jgi:hypothetical protein
VAKGTAANPLSINKDSIEENRKDSARRALIPYWEKSDQRFKEWTRDTLPHLYHWQKMSDKYVKRKEILLDADSSSITTLTHYDIVVNDHQEINESLPREIQWVIAVLKDYDEMPPFPFQLSFIYSMYYEHSPIEEMRYNFQESEESIEVSHSGVIPKLDRFAKSTNKV